MSDYRQIDLPCFGMKVGVRDGGGWIESDLTKHKVSGPDAHPVDAAFDAIESLVLAHACAGIEVDGTEYVEGIETAVFAVIQNYE